MDFQLITCEKAGQIAYITLNRPEKANAVNQQMANELREAWADFQNSNARVAIVTGKGRSFSAGADVGAAHRGEKFDLAPGMPGLAVDVTKPVIAAVNGYCGGMGLVLAMQCDIRFAASTAQFGYPEARIGISGLLGAELTKYMPVGIAMELLLTGQPITAQRAYEVGFVNKVTAPEELMPEAVKMAQLMSKNAPLVMKALKIMGYWGSRSPHREGTAIRLQMVEGLSKSEDAKEGVSAFFEKREPTFEGK